MPASLIRSRAMIAHALDRHHWNEVTDGAVFQEDGVIAEIGSFAQLSRKHPDASVIGTGNEILLPGFVNGSTGDTAFYAKRRSADHGNET